MYSPLSHFCIAKCKPPPLSATTIRHLPLRFWVCGFYRFLRCFGYLGTGLHHLGLYNKNTATHHRWTVTSISSWYRGIPPLYIPLAIAWLTPSPFCVTCLSRLASWVLPATLLVHISDLHLPLHTYHIIVVHILLSYLVSQVCSRIYTIAIFVCALCKSGHTKKENKLLSKEKERAKKLVSKCHSIIPHCT